MEKLEQIIENLEKIKSLNNEIKNVEKVIKGLIDKSFFDPYFQFEDIVAVSWVYYLPEPDYNDPRGFSHADLEIMSIRNLNDSQKSELGNDNFYKQYRNWTMATYYIRDETTYGGDLLEITKLFEKISTDLITHNFNYGEGRVVVTRDKVMFFR